MTRRRLTVRRIDPWSVLKFGAVANVVLLLIWLLVVGVIFYIVDRIGLVDQVCDIVLEVGFEACGINAGNLFRAIAMLGLLGVVILTAVLVFLSFLHNLIADLTGGLTFTVHDDTPLAQRPAGGGPAATTAGTTTGGYGSGRPPVPPLGSDRVRPGRATGEQPRSGVDQPAGRPVTDQRAGRTGVDQRADRTSAGRPGDQPARDERDRAGGQDRGDDRDRGGRGRGDGSLFGNA